MQNVCANPKCSNVLTGSQRRACSNKCRQRLYRLRKKREKIRLALLEEKALSNEPTPELDFVLDELEHLLKPDFDVN